MSVLGTRESLKHFFSLRGAPPEWSKKLDDLDEAQLTALHKEMIRGRIGGQTSAAVGTLAAVPTMGVSGIAVAVGARKAQVNGQRIDMIEKRLHEEGWTGHKKGASDFAMPLMMSTVGLAVGGCADGLLDQLVGGGSGAAPPPTGAEIPPSEPPPAGAVDYATDHFWVTGEDYDWHNAVAGGAFAAVAMGTMAYSGSTTLDSKTAARIDRREELEAKRANTYLYSGTRETAVEDLSLPKNHRECLALLEIGGWDVRLNDRKRLMHYIKQSDGDIECCKSWIEQYVAGIR